MSDFNITKKKRVVEMYYFIKIRLNEKALIFS
jgi:hypothetical protein